MASDRNAFLASVQTDDEGKILLAHIDDMLRICEKACSARFSAFLSEAESALCERYLKFCGASNYMLYGGYEGAQRTVLGVFPHFEEPMKAGFPIKAVKFYGRGTEGLTHRDFLGSLMALGITRSSVGDIVCREDKAYAMLLPAAAEMAAGITKIGRAGVKSEYAAEDESIVREDSFAEICGTVASMRLDSIVSTAVRQSREKAARLIRSGAVSVNHGAAESVSETVKEGDVISVRGYGRYILACEGMRTAKDRIHIKIKKYL